MPADWVTLDDRMYLVHHMLNTHALQSGLDRPRIRLEHGPRFAGAYRLATCDPESRVHAVFDRKYGPRSRTVLEVIPTT